MSYGVLLYIYMYSGFIYMYISVCVYPGTAVFLITVQTYDVRK